MPLSPLVSRLPGRLRLRHDWLRRTDDNCAFRATLAGWEGVLSTEGNAATGGVLVLYDPARLAPSDMEERVAACLAEMVGAAAPPTSVAKPTRRPRRSKFQGVLDDGDIHRVVKIGMMATMGGSLLALAASKKFHAVLGGLHLAFLAFHLVKYRKKLLR